LLSEAARIAQTAGDYYIAAWSENFMAAILHERGKLKRALDIARHGLEIAKDSPAAAGPYCRLCIIPYEMNELEKAAESARLALYWSNLTGDSTKVIAYLYLALIRLAEGNTIAADEAMVNADRAANDPVVTPSFHARHTAGRVMFAIRLDDLVTATKWGKLLQNYPDCFPFEFAHVPARLLIAQGEKAKAAEQLRDIYQKAVQVDAQGLTIGIRVCQALAAVNEGEALTFLSEALEKGESEGYIRTFVDEGKLLKPLLKKILARGITPSYTTKLLNFIESEEGLCHHQDEMTMPYESRRILSDRELEILKLVESGLSNRQIANELFISLNTAKAHIHNIFEKLNTKTRIQVVKRAREMKLI